MFAVTLIINLLIMKKQILNIGKALSKSEQKSINGGLMIGGGVGNCRNTITYVSDGYNYRTACDLSQSEAQANVGKVFTILGQQVYYSHWSCEC